MSRPPRAAAAPRRRLGGALLATLTLTLLPLAALGQSAPEQAVPRPVVSEIVSAEPLPARSFPGTVAGRDAATLAFQTGGRLASLSVQAGDRVAAGQELAALDQITLAQQTQAAQAALDAARAEADLAQRRYARGEALQASGTIRASDLEQLRAARDASAAQADSAQADLARAQDAEGFATLTAPRDAIVLSTAVEPGQTVLAGAEVLQLVDPDGREAVIDVPAELAALLGPGAEFSVARAAGDAPPVAARLRLIDPRADSGLDTRRLRLTLDGATDDFRIGTLVSASYSARTTPLITLPQAAIAGTADAPAVWRIEGPGRTARLTPVTLGEPVGPRIAITAGLTPGDEVATRGAQSLSEGQPVGPAVEIPGR